MTNRITQVLFYVPQNDPSILYYFLCDPNNKVNIEIEAYLTNTSIIRTLYLCLIAFYLPVRGQEWRNSIQPDILI